MRLIVVGLQSMDYGQVIYDRGCLRAGEDWVERNLVPVAAVAVALSVLQVAVSASMSRSSMGFCIFSLLFIVFIFFFIFFFSLRGAASRMKGFYVSFERLTRRSLFFGSTPAWFSCTSCLVNVYTCTLYICVLCIMYI